MSYLVLARRWRPRKFSDLVGQDVVVRTLKNALDSGNLAHAYLLCGIRGVGKTTIARLMAMAVNCEQPEGGEPCGGCSACEGIIAGSNLDVQEMDAASHTGVDDVREILDSVRYPPGSLKFKVYIIDEAHMLSKSAFNALLKTLEEPPAKVLFILATTEPEKLPVTVRSRCQRFDLRRLAADEIAAYLTHVFTTEKFHAEPAALLEIARAADGSVRDALSLAERVLAYAPDGMSAEDVRQALGMVQDARVRLLSEAVFAGDAREAVTQLREAVMAGMPPGQLLHALGRIWHQLACIQVDPALVQEEADADRRVWLESQAGRLDGPGLDMRYQVLLHGLRDLSLVDERLGAEMILMRLCGLCAISPVGGLAGDPPEAVEKMSSAQEDPGQASEPEQVPSETMHEADLPLDRETKAGDFTSWEEAVQAYAAIRPGIAALLEDVVCVEFDAKVRLALDRQQERMIATAERSSFAEWLGREVFWEHKQDHGGESLSQMRARQARAEEEHRRQVALQDPHVQALMQEMGAHLLRVLPPGSAEEQQVSGESA